MKPISTHTAHAVAATILATMTLALTSCATHHDAPSATPTATQESSTLDSDAHTAGGAHEPLTDKNATTTSTTQYHCQGTNWTLVADTWCMYPASVQWIDDTSILPTQPDQIDWTDPDAVAAAFLTTVRTWDTTIDASAASADHRAAIYTLNGQRTPDTSDPAVAHGQGEYLAARPRGATATLTIHHIYTSGEDTEPRQPDGTWRREIDYTRTITYHDTTLPTILTGTAYLTLTPQPDSTWLVTDYTHSTENPQR